jgi:hypothetical protein
MSLTGIVKDGRISLDGPIGWPNGTEVCVIPLPGASQPRSADQLALADTCSDPAALTRWIAEFDDIPPLMMSATEEGEWQAARDSQRQLEAQKSLGIEQMFKRAAE